jgi:tetratricopeptide (TPR) repeat protein
MGWALPLSLCIAMGFLGLWHVVRTRVLHGSVRLSAGFTGRLCLFIVLSSAVLNLASYGRYVVQQDYSTVHAPNEIKALVGANAKISEHGCSLAGYGNRIATERDAFDFSKGVTPVHGATHLFANIFRVRRVRPEPMEADLYSTPVGVLTVKRVPSILYRLNELPPAYRLSLYEEGEELLRQGRHEEALGKFVEAEQANPGSGVLKRMQGIALFKLGRFAAARARLHEALERLPEDYTANAYLVAILTIEGRYEDAYEHLEWMERYYDRDIGLRRVLFDYREILLTTEGMSPQGPVPSLSLLACVLGILSNSPVSHRTSVSCFPDLVLPAVSPRVVRMLREIPAVEAATSARRQFAEALGRGDFKGAAASAGRYSELRGSILEPALAFEEIYPIGGTPAYPLASLRVSAGFIERKLFFEQVASYLRAGGRNRGELVLAAFDWLLRNVWPVGGQGEPSMRNPRQIAVSGLATCEEMNWLFCVLLEGMGLDAVVFLVNMKDEVEQLPLIAVNCGGPDAGWYLCSPEKGLPLVAEDGTTVASVDDFVDGRAGIPGFQAVDVGKVASVTVLFVSEAEAFLPAAKDLESLFARSGHVIRCFRTMGDFDADGASIMNSFPGTGIRVNLVLWPYPFHVAVCEPAVSRTDGGAGEGIYPRARILQLTGKCEEALRMIEANPGHWDTYLVDSARCGAGDYEGVVRSATAGENMGAERDRMLLLEGDSLRAQGRSSKAAEVFGAMSGPRAALGRLLAENAAKQQVLTFRIPQE